MTTLLQKSLSIKTSKPKQEPPPEKEMEEVALAWVRGEINITQITKGMGLDNTSFRVYAKLAHALKGYVNRLGV